MIYFAVILALVVSFGPVALLAQSTKPSTLAELAVYNGPDRDQLLVAGAKKEGKVVWYTALAGGSYKELARAFEAKYGVPVEAYRGASRGFDREGVGGVAGEEIFDGRGRKFATFADADALDEAAYAI